MSEMEDLKTWIVKILLPSLVVVSIKVAIENRKKTISVFSIISSFIIGVGTAFIFSPLILSTVEEKYITVVGAIVTLAGERIWIYCIYKFDVEKVLAIFFDKFNKNKFNIF